MENAAPMPAASTRYTGTNVGVLVFGARSPIAKISTTSIVSMLITSMIALNRSMT